MRTSPESSKGENPAGLVIVQQREILELQTGYGRSRLVGDLYIEVNGAFLLFGSGCGTYTERQSLRRGRRSGLGLRRTGILLRP